MPTRRQFDMVIVTLILFHPVKGLINMVAARHANDSDASPLEKSVAGATRIIL